MRCQMAVNTRSTICGHFTYTVQHWNQSEHLAKRWTQIILQLYLCDLCVWLYNVLMRKLLFHTVGFMHVMLFFHLNYAVISWSQAASTAAEPLHLFHHCHLPVFCCCQVANNVKQPLQLLNDLVVPLLLYKSCLLISNWFLNDFSQDISHIMNNYLCFGFSFAGLSFVFLLVFALPVHCVYSWYWVLCFVFYINFVLFFFFIFTHHTISNDTAI